jgi:hypothetical protein
VHLGLVLADDPCDAAAAEPGPVLAVEYRVIVVAGLVEPVFCQVGGQQHSDRSLTCSWSAGGSARLRGCGH